MRRIAFIFTLIVVCSFFSGAVLTTAQAGSYPDRNINLIIPGTPGSIIDITGRIVAEEMTKILGQKVVPMDKPGGSFTLGTDFVVRSKPDGYTLSYTNSSGMVSARVAKPEIVPYGPDDLVPLGLHLYFPMGFAVQASSPWKTFEQLVEYAKKNPGAIRLSTSGKFSSAFYIMKMIESAAGIKMTQVPYKGGKAVIAAILGGHVEACIDAGLKFTPHVKAGKLRILLASKRMKALPDVPTPQELGYNIDIFSPWFAFYAPKGTPEEVTKVLISAIKKAINEPESKAKIEKMGFLVDYGTPDELEKLIPKQYKELKLIMDEARAREK
jgi:tripartite-type tricarboxylate transporter receptor subunit TctC